MTPWAQIAASREPQPHLLGSEIEPYPYISAYGLLLRVTRLTALEPTDWFQTLGIRRSHAPLSDLQAGRVSRARFEAALGMSATPIPTWWQQEAWSPLQTGGALDRCSQPIRTCPDCAAHGYHTALFQLPSIQSCPWHGCALSDRCPVCRQPTLGQPDAMGRMGRCACGHDPFDANQATIGMWKFPTVRAEAWLHAYLPWAAEQRERRHFIATERSDRWRDGFARLAEPPAALAGIPWNLLAPGSRMEDRQDAEPGVDPPAQEFWGWCALGDTQPLTLVPLPPGTPDRLAEVTQQVVAGFPANTCTPVEWVASQGFEKHATLGENAARHPNCFIAPHGRSDDGSSWIHLSAVDRETLHMGGRLIEVVLDACGTKVPEGDYSRQATRVQRLAEVRGRSHLAWALRALLVQGYGQGLDALLRSSLRKAPADEWWLPVAEARCREGYLEQVRICWIPNPAPRIAVTPPVRAPLKATRSRRRKTKAKAGKKRLAAVR